MNHAREFFIDGQWVPASSTATHTVVNPTTEEPIGEIAVGNAADVERAVAAAAQAFPAAASTSIAEREQMLERILEAYLARAEDLARSIMLEVGVPQALARGQVQVGVAHIRTMLDVLKSFSFESSLALPAPQGSGSIRVAKEPIGVCALITPWNAPVGQVLCKLVPAIAAGCTSVVKPSEVTPLCTLLLAEIIESAHLPRGLFNLVNGDGPTTGQALVSHPNVDMVSFTGSLGGGVAVAQAATPTVKRVHQELGGKSPNIILRDADFDDAVQRGVAQCFFNSGQACAAPTRMLVPSELQERAMQVAATTAAGMKVGAPDAPDTQLGPLVSRAHFERVRSFIRLGIEEGATLVAGGLDRPAGVQRGFFVQPTVFANVTPQMTIAREEIFGPVLSIIPYDTEDDAIRIANDTKYGLAGYVSSRDEAHARRVAARIRAGYLCINYPRWNAVAPFGGYKQSGNGRQYGAHGLEDYLEIKSIIAG